MLCKIAAAVCCELTERAPSNGRQREERRSIPWAYPFCLQDAETLLPAILGFATRTPEEDTICNAVFNRERTERLFSFKHRPRQAPFCLLSVRAQSMTARLSAREPGVYSLRSFRALSDDRSPRLVPGTPLKACGISNCFSDAIAYRQGRAGNMAVVIRLRARMLRTENATPSARVLSEALAIY